MTAGAHAAVAGAEPAADRLLERAEHLRALAGWAEAAVRRGRIVLVGGEAGVGKTSLVRSFLRRLPPRTEVFEGACEALSPPPPLAPLTEVAARVGGALAEAVASGAEPVGLFHELLALLTRRPGSVLVIEDLHWGDDATLDLVRFLSRRVDEVPVLLVATYRDDEVDAVHPLRVLLGDLAARRSVTRLRLAPLSREAVAELAASSDLDPPTLFEQTGGNPFFVTETLAAGVTGVPETVRDAVLARAARLAAPARRALEAAAVIGSPAPMDLLRAVAGEDAPHLDHCVAAGVLRSHAEGVAFRHELARTAVREAILPARRTELHGIVLARLESGGGATAATLAHHAGAAADRAATYRHAERAARDAARVGSHREAAAQYRRALQALDPNEDRARASLLVRYSEECALCDQIAEATAGAEQALSSWRSLDDRSREGDVLRWLSRLAWMSDRIGDAERLGREAIALLERLSPSAELARAYATLGQLFTLNQGPIDTALSLSTQALVLAEHLDEPLVAAQAGINVGLVRALRLEAGGIEQMEGGIARARDAGSDEHVARGLFHLGRVAWQFRRAAEAERRWSATEAYCTDRGVEFWRDYALAFRADVRLDLGDWTGAEALAREVWRRSTPASPTVRTHCVCVVLGILHARRGTPDPDAMLEIATRRAAAVPSIGIRFGLAAGKAEAAWLAGRLDSAVADLRVAHDLARAEGLAAGLSDEGWRLAEICWWLHLAGEPAGAEGIGPFVAQIAGDWRAAAEEWEELGYPYHRAQALAHSGEETALREALQICLGLGARPLARYVTRRLRELGVRDIPRIGTVARDRAAGLTARELDVLTLLTEGLRDRDIAGRLVISERTVHHHVTAILRKLDAPSRTAAVAAAARLELTKDG